MKITLISHFFNEEFLLPYWLRHHVRLFDHGVMIDYGSTDQSVALIRQWAPRWQIITTRNREFDAQLVDEEVMDIESNISGWKMCLNTTEFLYHNQLHEYLVHFCRENPGMRGIRPSAISMVDSEYERSKIISASPLWTQRCHGIVDGHSERSRLLHNHVHGSYGIGRHETGHPDVAFVDDIFVMWFGWCPIEFVKQRKLQIQERMSHRDRLLGHGYQHIIDEEKLEQEYLRRQNSNGLRNILELPEIERLYLSLQDF